MEKQGKNANLKGGFQSGNANQGNNQQGGFNPNRDPNQSRDKEQGSSSTSSNQQKKAPFGQDQRREGGK